MASLPPRQRNPAGATLPYDPVPGAAADRIIETALRLVAEIGIRFEPGGEADALLSAAGCHVGDDGVVRFPENVVRRALESMARSVTLWNRDATSPVTIDDRNTLFIPGMTCIKVPDEETGEPRDSTAEDLALITRVADGLPNIDAICMACKDVSDSTMHGEIGEFVTMARNTTKPLEYLCEHTESLHAVIEMAAAIRGGPRQLAEKPYFMHTITPLPLFYTRIHCDQIIAAARAGVPMDVGTLAIGGASAPITVAGCLVYALATDFAGIVLGQATHEGCFCIGSTQAYFMEPATGGIGNLPQTMLAEQLMAQIRRRLGLPHFGGLGGKAWSRRFDRDSALMIGTMMEQLFFIRPATCSYLGSHDQGITYSLPALLLCDDYAGMLRVMWEGSTIDDDTLALEVLREVGLFGTVLGHEHTARYCRTGVWDSRYLGANEPLSTTDKPDLDLHERIDIDLKARIAAPPPPPLPEELDRALGAIHSRSSDMRAA